MGVEGLSIASSLVILGSEIFKKLNIEFTSGSKILAALFSLSAFSFLFSMTASFGVAMAGGLVGFSGLGGFKIGFGPPGWGGSLIFVF